MSPHLRACNHANCGGVTELALVKLLMPQRPVMDHDMSGVVINVDIDTFGNLLLQLELLLSTILKARSQFRVDTTCLSTWFMVRFA